jgi:hypothetical protein
VQRTKVVDLSIKPGVADGAKSCGDQRPFRPLRVGDD